MEVSNDSIAIDSNDIKHETKVSKFRNYASQILAVLAMNIVKCSVGSTMGFTSVLVAELHKKNAEIRMSVSDISWFSSKLFMVPVGALLLGALTQRIGSRRTMLLSSVCYIISFLTFYIANSPEMLLGAQALVGLLHSSSIGPGVTYVVEITQPALRGTLTATTTLSTMCAAFLVVLLSNFYHWRTIALVILVFPVTGFITVFIIPDSPHWLASKKKFNEAEAALCWLRGWCSPQNVESEFNKLKESYSKIPQNLSSTINDNKTKPNRLPFLKDSIDLYLHRSFYVPLLLMCLLFTLYNCTGGNPLMIYSIVIFTRINAPIDAHVAASIFDAMRILGALACILLIRYTGKKKLMYITLTGAALSLFISSAGLFMKEYNIYSDVCTWIVAIAMMFSAFSITAGIEKVVTILNAEIFSTRYRSICVAIALFTNYVVQAICNKLFLPLVEAATLAGVFILYGVGCIVTCIVFHYLFPETEGKTLQEIEDHFKSVEKSKMEENSSKLLLEKNISDEINKVNVIVNIRK